MADPDLWKRTVAHSALQHLAANAHKKIAHLQQLTSDLEVERATRMNMVSCFVDPSCSCFNGCELAIYCVLRVLASCQGVTHALSGFGGCRSSGHGLGRVDDALPESPLSRKSYTQGANANTARRLGQIGHTKKIAMKTSSKVRHGDCGSHSWGSHLASIFVCH